MHKLSKAAALSAATLLMLSACGGGGGDSGGANSAYVDGTDVPIGVEQRIDDVIAFARQLIAGTSELTEPAILGNAKLATDDTAEPVDL